MIEVEFKHEESPILQCQLFLKEELSDPIEVLDIEVTNRRPHSFVFENLTPNTWYQAIFTSVQGPPAIATFKTKIADEEMETFKILALSCDRHSRLLMGKSYKIFTLLRSAIFSIPLRNWFLNVRFLHIFKCNLKN